MAKPTPLPPEPTLADIAASIAELHVCVEANNERAAAYQDDMRKHVENTRDQTKVMIDLIQRDRHDSKNRDMVLDGRIAAQDKSLDLARKGFLTVEGQLRALADDKAITDAAGHARQETIAGKLELATSNFDDLAVKVDAVSRRIGVGKSTPSVLAMSPRAILTAAVGIATVMGSVIAGAIALFGKIAPLLH